MSDKIVLEGPDGMLYEIPRDVLAQYVVPGPQVGALRARLAAARPAPSAPASSPPPLPPGHHRMPPPAAPAAAPVVLNIYLGSSAPPTVQMHSAAAPHTHVESSIEGYHLAFDENGIPHNHSEMLWGDYIDKQGRPAVGYHSHDPASGNAQ